QGRPGADDLHAERGQVRAPVRPAVARRRQDLDAILRLHLQAGRPGAGQDAGLSVRPGAMSARSVIRWISAGRSQALASAKASSGSTAVRCANTSDRLTLPVTAIGCTNASRSA